jgi:hypothetical protein
MQRYFNITGACNPKEHYMVNLDSRLAEIKKMVDMGKYFVINRGRQYGKTTTLNALEEYLSDDYIVISLDFQGVTTSEFQQEGTFVKAFAREMWAIKNCRQYMNNEVQEEIKSMRKSTDFVMADLFAVLSDWCDESEKPIILIIDEVDNASNNQIFLDFLALLRQYYLQRNKRPTFKSVILAGVHDIRNLRQKIRPDTEHKHNSPWNIASPFDIDMSFSVQDVAGMLTDYENDNHTGMNINEISQLIYDYTSGYPVLVSTLCKYMDENFGWKKENLVQSEKKLLMEKTPLFESLVNKLEDDEKLRKLIYTILFKGEKLPFSLYDASFNSAIMYGFLKNQNGSVAVANRIFETILCDWFLSQEYTESEMFRAAGNDKNQFIENNQLNMEHILEKFIQHFNDIYGTQTDKFKEDDGRKLFLLYLRPIINGVGNAQRNTLTTA